MNLNCCQLLRFSITSSFFMQVEFLVLVLPKKKKKIIAVIIVIAEKKLPCPLFAGFCMGYGGMSIDRP